MKEKQEWWQKRLGNGIAEAFRKLADNLSEHLGELKEELKEETKEPAKFIIPQTTCKNKIVYYFAYGSNMNHQQMEDRCPNSKFLKRVYFKDYKFVYDGWSQVRNGAVGNIVESKGNLVWGGLFRISQKHLAALDSYENYPQHYDRKAIKVKDKGGRIYKAITYFRVGKKLGKPRREYRQIVIQGAQDCKLPAEYIKNNL